MAMTKEIKEMRKTVRQMLKTTNYEITDYDSFTCFCIKADCPYRKTCNYCETWTKCPAHEKYVECMGEDL